MDKMTWKEAGSWCQDRTHDYIWGDTAEDMIENAEEHLKTEHEYEWSKMTSRDVAALHFAINAHFPQEAENDNATGGTAANGNDDEGLEEAA